jgi:adenosine deaminase
MGEQDPTYLTDLVDLHLHLGSSSTPHFLWELAHEQGIKLPEKDYFSFIDSITIKEKTTYDHYLSFFDITELVQSSTYAVEKAMHEAISRAYRKANIKTIEVRFNPMLRNKGGEHDLDKIIFAATVGMKKACLEYPVKAGIILMMDRRFPKEKNLVVAQKAARFAHEGIIGLDVAGPLHEGFHVEDLVEPVRIARDAGLGVTIHTGEVTPPEEVANVVKLLSPHRIGHGIKSVEDPMLLEELAKRGIVLEVCPTSNIQTQAARDWEDIKHILMKLKSAGVAFTINSDGPELLATNVKEEFERLLAKGVLTQDDVIACTKTAKEASFIR